MGLIRIKFDSLRATKDSVDSGTKGMEKIGKEIVQEIENHYIEANEKMNQIAKGETRSGRRIEEWLAAAGKISRQNLFHLRNLYCNTFLWIKITIIMILRINF